MALGRWLGDYLGDWDGGDNGPSPVYVDAGLVVGSVGAAELHAWIAVNAELHAYGSGASSITAALSAPRKQKRLDDDLLIEQVLDKWEAIERASLSPGHGPAETAQDGRRVPPESAAQPERSAIQIGGGNALPVVQAVTDVALAPLVPDAARAAIEARRKNNEAALLLLLMDL